MSLLTIWLVLTPILPMNPKIQPSARLKLDGKGPNDAVRFYFRLSEPLSESQISALEIMGATYLYQGGLTGAVDLDVDRLNAFAEFDCVLDIV